MLDWTLACTWVGWEPGTIKFVASFWSDGSRKEGEVNHCNLVATEVNSGLVMLSVFICTILCKFLRSKRPDYLLQNFLMSCSETVRFLHAELCERKAASEKYSCCLLPSPQIQMLSVNFFFLWNLWVWVWGSVYQSWYSLPVLLDCMTGGQNPVNPFLFSVCVKILVLSLLSWLLWSHLMFNWMSSVAF